MKKDIMEKKCSIRFKLSLLLVTSAMIGVILSSVGTFFYITHQMKNDGMKSLVEIVTMMSNTIVAALEFQDMDSIQITLNSVNHNENIQAIFLYDENQKLLTTYKKANDGRFNEYAAFVQSQGIIHKLTDPYENETSTKMLVNRPIFSSGEYIGTLTMVGNSNRIDKATYDLLVMQILVAILAIFLVILLTSRMKQMFILPIFKLKEAMQQFSQNPDSDARVEHESHDEFQVLFEGYNYMLEVIRERSRELDFQRMALDEHAIVTTMDSDGTITHINDKFCQISGYQQDDMLGNDYHMFLSDSHSEDFYAEVFKTLAEGKVWQGELHNKTKDGQYYWVAATIVPFLDDQGVPFKYIAVRTDITARKEAEETMRQARELAENATQAKSDFLANMSHEIRTPMNAVIGLTHLVLDTELSRHQRDYLKKVHAAANNLLGIINDILDFSKIEAGKLDMESVEFDMQEVLDHLTHIVSVKTSEKNLDFLVDIQPGVARMYIGDSLRIGQILINLVNNAVKFTEKGSIKIIIDHKEDRDGRAKLYFEVRDTGIGMTEEQCGRLFKAFSQADSSTTRKYGGTGLGLAISKSLVENMDGEIGVYSDPGKGSCFHFTCWLEPGDESHATEAKTPVELHHLNTLVVDDNPDAQEIMRRQLENLDMDVSTCSSGEQALERVVADPDAYDLIFMDWQMPGINGIDASKELRSKLPAEKAPKVILISAHNHTDSAEEMLANGIDGFICKPSNPSVLLDSIMNVMEHQITASLNDEKNKGYDVPEHLIGAHLLLAEDNDINQIVATGILEKANLKVTIANNGKEALNAVLKGSFDGVLMDIQMPLMNGFDATAAIRKDPRFTDLPILAMTANAMAEDREACIDAGMNDFITKPVVPETMLQTIAQWVKSSHPPESIIANAVENVVEKDTAPTESKDLALSEQNLSGIDIKDGLTRLGGDEQLYRRVLNKFSQGQSDALIRVRTAMSQGDVETAKRDAHTLKGVAGNIGAKALFSTTQTLEHDIGAGKALDEDLMVNIDHHLQIVLKSIASISPRTQHDTAPADATDWPAIQQQMDRLHNMIDDDDSEAIDVLDEIESAAANVYQQLGLGSVRNSVEEYDFETALQQFADVQKKLEQQAMHAPADIAETA